MSKTQWRNKGINEQIETLESEMGGVENSLFKKGALNDKNVTSDTSIIGLDIGCYFTNGVSTAYIPDNWGVLAVFKTDGSYSSYLYFGTHGNVWARVANNGSKTWYTAWKQLT